MMSTTRGNELSGTPVEWLKAAGRTFAAAITGLILALGVALGTAVTAQAQATNQLQDIQVQPLAGNRIELRLMTSGPAPAPLAFTIDNPARISIDLPGTTLALASRRKDVKVGPLDTILAAEAEGRTRVVLNLDTMVPYETRVDGNSIVVTLGAPGAADTAVASFPAAAPAAATAAAASVGRRIDNVDFRRGDNGGGRVVITLSDPGTPVDVRKEGDRILLTFAGTTLPDNLLKRLDVADFATPVSMIESGRTPTGARVSIAAKLPFEELAYQSDNHVHR